MGGRPASRCTCSALSDVQAVALAANATGLMLLTVLALGVLTPGLDPDLKLCVTGAFLAVSVPAMA